MSHVADESGRYLRRSDVIDGLGESVTLFYVDVDKQRGALFTTFPGVPASAFYRIEEGLAVLVPEGGVGID